MSNSSTINMNGQGTVALSPVEDGFLVKQLYNYSDKDLVNYLVDTDPRNVRKGLYESHGRDGTLGVARDAVENFEASYTRSKEVGHFLLSRLKEAFEDNGIKYKGLVDLDDTNIEIIPVREPFIEIYKVDKKGRLEGPKVKGNIANVRKGNNLGKYFVGCNFPVAKFTPESSDLAFLHELLHIYADKLGIPMREQIKYEGLFDRVLVKFLEEDENRPDLAHYYEKKSKYLEEKTKDYIV